MKPRLWLAGGTTEGRELAAFAAALDLPVWVTVATEYGASLLPQAANLHIITKRLEKEEMTAFLREKQITQVIDATHPYAALVTQNIRAACQKADVPYERVYRPSEKYDADCITVASMAEAAELLDQTEGNIFLTTGSKDLAVFTTIKSYRKRIFLRILPSLTSLNQTLNLNYPPKQIICMQGPFTTELNTAMFRQCQAKYVVTKDSGKPGGFQEKIEAAKAAGAKVIVVARPQESGDSLNEVKEMIRRLAK